LIAVEQQKSSERSHPPPPLEMRLKVAPSYTNPHCLNTILLLLINVMNIKENVLPAASLTDAKDAEPN